MGGSLELDADRRRVELLELKHEWMFHARALKVGERAPEEIILIDGEEGFLQAVYRHLLGREPDEGGLRFFLGQLKEGLPREAVLESIRATPEYQARRPSS